MIRYACFFSVLNAFVFSAAQAQCIDDFSDGDFTSNPAWIGTDAYWNVVELDGNLALHSNARSLSDTLYLSVPSTVSIGKWSLRIVAVDANFSTFNGIRIYLITDKASLVDPVSGYYLQFGTNNTDQIRLYRQDAGSDGSIKRTELGRSHEPQISGDNHALEMTVVRTYTGVWSVLAGNTEIFTAMDATYQESLFFGIWLKHTAGTAQAYFFDDVKVEADTTRPEIPEYPSAEKGDLVINEIYYDPPSNQHEFVELYNRSDKSINLADLTFSDSRKTPSPIVYQASVISPNSYAVLVQDGISFSLHFPSIDYVEPSGWPSLNNSGDTSILFRNDIVIDSVSYSPSWGGDGVSLERIDPDGPSNHSVNFGSSVSVDYATPGSVNSIYAPDRSPPVPVFVDQVSERTLEVLFDEPLDPESLSDRSFLISGTSVVSVSPASSTSVMVVFEGDVNVSHVTITGVKDLFGNVIDGLSVPIARLAGPGDLIINEIMFSPFADDFDYFPNQPEYVEIMNTAAYDISLRGIYWAKQANESENADTLFFQAGIQVIKPGSYAVVFSDPNRHLPSLEQTDLVLAFPSIQPILSDITLLPLYRSSLSLSNSGDMIRLHNADDVVVDSVEYSPDWHHPSLREATGISIERISPLEASDRSMNWSSSVFSEGGTPGRRNSIFLQPATRDLKAGLGIDPSPFSPDGDGFDDIVSFHYTLNHDVSSVRVRIYDAEGRHVRTLEEARLTARTGRLFWNGLDDEERPLRIGVYIVLFEALDTAGGTVEVYKEPFVLARKLK